MYSNFYTQSFTIKTQLAWTDQEPLKNDHKFRLPTENNSNFCSYLCIMVLLEICPFLEVNLGFFKMSPSWSEFICDIFNFKQKKAILKAESIFRGQFEKKKWRWNVKSVLTKTIKSLKKASKSGFFSPKNYVMNMKTHSILYFKINCGFWTSGGKKHEFHPTATW